MVWDIFYLNTSYYLKTYGKTQAYSFYPKKNTVILLRNFTGSPCYNSSLWIVTIMSTK